MCVCVHACVWVCVGCSHKLDIGNYRQTGRRNEDRGGGGEVLQRQKNESELVYSDNELLTAEEQEVMPG